MEDNPARLPDMSKLTALQDRFCHEFPADWCAARAVVRAGYAKGGAKQQAWKNLQNPKIQKRIAEVMARANRRSGLTVESVLASLQEVLDRCMQAVEVLDKTGAPTGEWTFQAQAALKALEMQGKYLRMWVERHETVDVDAARAYASRVCDIVVKHVADPATRAAILADLEALGDA